MKRITEIGISIIVGSIIMLTCPPIVVWGFVACGLFMWGYHNRFVKETE